MNGIHKALSRLPAWVLSILTILAILWLTLAPKPLGENPPPLFPGADKVAHLLMFGGLSIMLLLDIQRRHNWRPDTLVEALICALFSSFLGIAIEFAQDGMGLGRGFDYGDIIADCLGSFVFASLYVLLQKFWV